MNCFDGRARKRASVRRGFCRMRMERRKRVGTIAEAERILKGGILDPGEQERKKQRDRIIIRTSVTGILTNIFLAALKAAVGVMTHSIAIVLDAVNNLSDAASSLITIVGTKLAGKEADRKHPFGHGRVEYLSAMVIALIVLYAGITAFVESLRKIIHPDTPDYSTTALFIVAAGVLVKIVLGKYVKGIGRQVNSDSLVNAGEDAALDAVISASTLAAAGIYLRMGISLEAWLGAGIALMIIKAGVGMLQDALSKVLGERADADLARAIKETVLSFPDVSGAYDLVLNNYGPDAFNGSIHIEVPDTYAAAALDELVRAITAEVYLRHHVIFTAVGVYSVNTKNDQAAQMRDRIRELVLKQAHVLQMHGFYVNESKKTIRFDIVVSFDAKDRNAVYEAICSSVQGLYPEYTLQLAMDTDFSEI